MDKPILIVKNITHENPGLITDILDKNNLRFEIVDLSQKEFLPEIENYALLIIMGGPDSANDNSNKILKELTLIKTALSKEIPIFGICLGLQLLVKMCGGQVYKNPLQEIGFKHNNEEWYKIKLTQEGLKDPLFKGINDDFIVFQLHGETVKLNKDLVLLGTSDYCTNQVVKYGQNNYGIQFHFELTEELFANLLEKAPELKGHNLDPLVEHFNEIKKDYIERGTLIFTNYLRELKFIPI